MPTAMSPRPAGSANAAGSFPSIMARMKLIPTTRRACGAVSQASARVPVSTRRAAGVAAAATVTASTPAAATAIHGRFAPLPGR